MLWGWETKTNMIMQTEREIQKVLQPQAQRWGGVDGTMSMLISPSPDGTGSSSMEFSSRGEKMLGSLFASSWSASAGAAGSTCLTELLRRSNIRE